MSDIDIEKLKQEIKDEAQQEKAKEKQKFIAKLAQEVIEEWTFKTVVTGRNDEIYFYENGIYVFDKGKKKIRQILEEKLNERSTQHLVKEIIEKVKRLTFSMESKEEFGNQNINSICLNNGVFNLDTKELKPFSKDLIFLSKIPVDYNKDAQCPLIKEFLKDLLYKEDINVIQEWFGYCLYREYFLKKAIILVGDPHGGKTQVVRLLESFLGKSNVVGISLQKLTKDKFSIINLYQKLANIYDDLDFDDVENNGAFKMATGRSTLTGEYKFGDSFGFVNFAKLMFATNKIPRTKDVDDEAYYSRWIVLRFDNIFDESNPKRDIDILKKITTKEEMSGLLNYALIGLDRLKDRKVFSYRKTAEEVKFIMQRSGNSLAGFVQDELRESDGNAILKEVMYNRYSSYAREKGLSRDTMDKVGKSLHKFAPYITDGWIGKKRAWRNVNFMDSLTETGQEQEKLLDEINQELEM